MTKWLKMLGSTERKMDDAWLDTGNFGSRKRMHMKPGDRVAYYATGRDSVFAVGTITSFSYPRPDNNREGFDWCINVELDHHRRFVREGVPLEDVSVEDRDLRQSIRRQSHIKLTDAEFEAIEDALAR